MNTLKRFFGQGLGVAAIAGAILFSTPTAASADNIVFTVNEDAITDANAITFTTDRIAGTYNESLTLTATTFTAYLVVNFADYYLGNPSIAVDSQLTAQPGDAPNTNLYGMYALVTVTGNYTATVGTTTSYFFDPLTASAQIWVDPNRDTTTTTTGSASTTGGATEDQQILAATALNPDLSFGSVFVRNGVVLGGSYGLVFTDPVLVSPTGPIYWPDLTLLNLIASSTGDVSSTTQGSSFPNNVFGEADLTFSQASTVPEPASLLLLGTGLLAAGFSTRRRRKQ